MRWELHAHTRQGSKCGWLDAADVVALHRRFGFDGIVITDHYNNANLERFYGTPLEQAQAWLSGWRCARAAGEAAGLTVLFGLEARLQDCDNDYLIFGAEPEFVLAHPRLNYLTLPELHALCREAGALLVQAHPNRKGCHPADASDLDGIEIWNTSVRHENHNELTQAQAAAHPELIRTSGSDFHRMEDVGRGGIVTARTIRTSAELAACLREGDFTLVHE